jgi:hypothetical protein
VTAADHLSNGGHESVSATPLVFFVFNRPEVTARTFAAITRARPRHLIIAADGSRGSWRRSLCETTRAVVDVVDWDCESAS